MDREVLVAIKTLLDGERVLGLASIIDGEPDAGLLPFAVRSDYGAVFVQASQMARHSRGLQPDGRVGVLIHAQDSPGADPLQIPRLLLAATVTVLTRNTRGWDAAEAAFLARFPQAEMTLGLGDFNLYALELGHGRYVEGFGRAFNVGPATFAQAGSLAND
jgi:heme iron utilization protein